MKFSLLLSISAICLSSSDAFTIQKLSSPSSVLQLSAKKESFVIDPDDPYANLLKAYGKKSVLVEEPKEIAIPSIPDTIVPDTTVVVTPDVTSSASTSSSTSLDSITDAANQAIAAAQEAVKAASDLGSTASTSTTTTTPSSSVDVAPPLVDFLKEPEKFKSMADQASSSVEKVLSVVNSPSTPSTTGASTGTTVVEPGKTVTLYQYLVNPATHTSTSAPTESFDAIANAKEKFSIMLENTLKFSNSVTESTTSGELTKGLAVPASMKSVAAGATAAGGATATAGAGFDLSSVFNSAEWDQLAKNLNLEEYGAWYVAALALFFGVNQSAAKKSATNVYEKEMSMAKEKADVAASAALDAVEQVQKAKELASTKTTTLSGGVKTDLLSEAKVRELQVEKVSI